MIDNFWIFVTQLASVLVYIGITFRLYRLLASQKDATIEAKDATIENLQTRLQQAESQVPDILVTLLKERQKVSQEELERLKHDKDKSSDEIRSLKERQEITSETVVSLLSVIKVFQLLSELTDEEYKEFIIDVCGGIVECVSAILASKNLTDLFSKQGKIINETTRKEIVHVPREKLIVRRFSALYSYVLLKDNTIMIDKATLRELTRKHEAILSTVAILLH